MKKLLYITVNSKPEEISSSKTVGRAFVNKFIQKHEGFKVEELDLYKEHIPRLEYPYFIRRNCIVDKDAFQELDEKEKKEVQRIVELCDQFKSADVYVIAAPMWSLSFPAPLKEYIDCIVQEGKTLKISEESIQGLLDDKPRSMIYIQSSGASIPWLLKIVLNKGLNYVESIMRSMGIKKFHELLVDGTGSTEEERQEAIKKALEKIDDAIDDVWR